MKGTRKKFNHITTILLNDKLHEESFDQSCFIGDCVLASMHRDGLKRLLNDGLDISAVDLTVVQELDTLLDDGVPHTDHVLAQVLDQGQETSLGIEPGVSAKLLVVRLQALDDSADTKLIVTLNQ